MNPIARWAPMLGMLAAVAVAGAEPAWQDAASLSVEGRGWPDATPSYVRFPESARARVPESVWGLSRQSAGIAVRFETTARQVSVRWALSDGGLSMPHMPATGVSGVDLYARDAGAAGGWAFVQNGRPSGREGNVARFALPAGTRECLLYLPLYNGVSKLEVGVEPGETLKAAAPRPEASRRPVVFYGTSIVQGACASRPGMAHVAILGRRLDRPVVNLGFSGSGKMEPGVADVLAELDPAAFVVDCLWNVSELDPAEAGRRVDHLVRTLRARRPAVPIVFVGQSDFHPGRHPTAHSTAQERAVRALEAEGFRGLYLVDGATLLGSDGEGTVDGVHPNDLGMMRHADAILPALRAALGAR